MSISAQIKKGGRHTKKEIEERRSKVFQLHFEYGYSARKISQMININRNTINKDISFCYSRLRIDYDQDGFDDWLNKQLFRLESQRARLVKKLDMDITFQEKMQIEKMILDLDNKINSFIFKVKTSKSIAIDGQTNFLNQWMAKNGYEDRFMSTDTLFTIPEKSRDKIFKLLENK